MKPKRVTVSLTEKQFNDVVTCVSQALGRRLGYGTVTRQEEILLELHRSRTLEKLKTTLASR